MTTIVTTDTKASALQCMSLLCAVWLLLPGVAVAQETLALRLSLEEAQTRAVTASHRLAEARARVATAEATTAVRQTANRPIVGLLAGYTRTNHVTEFVLPSPTGVPRVLYPDAPDNYRTRLDLQWPIYSGGRADALERAARAEASAAAADVLDALWTLVLWLDRPPFQGQQHYDAFKAKFLTIGVELATSSQRDTFAEKPVSIIKYELAHLNQPQVA